MDYTKMKKEELIARCDSLEITIMDLDRTIKNQEHLASTVELRDKEARELKEQITQNNKRIKALEETIISYDSKLKTNEEYLVKLSGKEEYIAKLNERHKQEIEDVKLGHNHFTEQVRKEGEIKLRQTEENLGVTITNLTKENMALKQIVSKFADMYAVSLKSQQAGLDAHIEIYQNLLEKIGGISNAS
jgi:chromosome segregation ATPase